MSLTLNVQGMHCPSCKMLIEEELEDNGATNITIDFNEKTKRGTVTFDGMEEDTAKELIEGLGDYHVTE